VSALLVAGYDDTGDPILAGQVGPTARTATAGHDPSLREIE